MTDRVSSELARKIRRSSPTALWPRDLIVFAPHGTDKSASSTHSDPVTLSLTPRRPLLLSPDLHDPLDLFAFYSSDSVCPQLSMAVTQDAPSGPLDRPSDGITVADIELQALQPASPTESEHTAAAQSGNHVRSAARDEPVLEEIVVHRSAETNAGDVNMVMSASASSKPTIFATERASQPEDADTSARGSDGREPPVSNNITHDLEGTSSSAAPPMEHEPSAPLPRSTAGARRQPTKPFFGLRKNAGNYGVLFPYRFGGECICTNGYPSARIYRRRLRGEVRARPSRRGSWSQCPRLESVP